MSILPTVGLARVSIHDQKEDLERQAQMLEIYCAAKGWEFVIITTQANALSTYCLQRGFTYEIIEDLGSGMNYKKKGLHKLLNLILQRKIKRLVITHKDRLLRFGAELIFTLCEIHNVEIILINQGADLSFQEELAQDVLDKKNFVARLFLKAALNNHHQAPLACS